MASWSQCSGCVWQPKQDWRQTHCYLGKTCRWNSQRGAYVDRERQPLVNNIISTTLEDKMQPTSLPVLTTIVWDRHCTSLAQQGRGSPWDCPYCDEKRLNNPTIVDLVRGEPCILVFYVDVLVENKPKAEGIVQNTNKAGELGQGQGLWAMVSLTSVVPFQFHSHLQTLNCNHLLRPATKAWPSPQIVILLRTNNSEG